MVHLLPPPRPGLRLSLLQVAALSLLAFHLLASARGASTTGTATYTVSSGTVTQTGQSYTASATDASAVNVQGTGKLTLNTCTISTSGATSSSDNSSFYGLNAGILAYTGGTLTMTGGSVTTSGSGANGIFAYGTGVGTLSDLTVTCTGNYAHGIMCSGGGTLTATNLTCTTSGTNSGVVATDRGSGTITVIGGSFTASGADSPGIYSTGVITATNGTYVAKSTEAIVIEGSNSVTATNCDFTAYKSRGVLMLQSQSGDAEGVNGVLKLTGGSLTVKAGPAFYVANAIGTITLTNVALSITDGVLAYGAANSRWGSSGSNGGEVKLTLVNQAAAGDLLADSIGACTATLTSASSLTGKATLSSVSIDSTSTWTVNGISTLVTLANEGTLALASPSYALTCSGKATLGGTLQVTLPSSAVAGASYTLISAGSLSGTFSKLSLVQSSTNLTGTLSYSSTAVTLTLAAGTVTTASTSRLSNVSIRGAAGTGNDSLIVGFVLGGSGSKQMLVRGVGPTLSALSVSNPLSDPTITLYNSGGTALGSNDNWGGGSTLTALFSSLGAYALPSASKDAALTATLGTGAYSSVITDSSSTGIALAETYDAAVSDSVCHLTNVSGRAKVGTGDNVLIAGFVITDGTSLNVVVRAVGPGIASTGLSVLANPVLSLYDSSGTLVATNDDWDSSGSLPALFSSLGATALSSGSKDAALYLSLAPGAYSAVVTGLNDTTGIALVEVYSAP